MNPEIKFKKIRIVGGGMNIFRDVGKGFRKAERAFDDRKRMRFLGELRVCPGGRHAWYETTLGYPVRKELGKV